jgi:ubiquinone/menaquinone biosynthesis C-methylase UbiE
MSKLEIIARQSRWPTGPLGWIVARIMAFDTARVNDEAVTRLGVKPDDRVLELGCGHGRTLARLGRQVAGGQVAGVDPSAVMRAAAKSRNARAIASGRMTLSEGSADAIPHPDHHFDRVLTVHTLYFWPDLDAGLREIRRVLRQGGTVLIAHRPADDSAALEQLPESIYRLSRIDALEAALLDAGFRAVATDYERGRKAAVAWTSGRA